MKLCIPLDMGLCNITPMSTEYLQLMLYQRGTEKVRIPGTSTCPSLGFSWLKSFLHTLPKVLC